jgi:predicted dienelactone hydrolase
MPRQARGGFKGARLTQASVAQGSGLPETIAISGITTSVWQPAAASGRAPLVVFSHGFRGSSTQSTFLMQALADHGYLVVAPNHRDSRRFGSRLPETPFSAAGAWNSTTYKDRAEDIKALIAGLKADPRLSNAIDWSKVGLAGHSLGGYTVLGLAGAWPGWRLPDVKAVLALSPYCAPFVQRGTLKALKVPVMYQGGTRDSGITPYVSKAGGAFDQSPTPAYFIDLKGAGHLAWTDLNPNFQNTISQCSVAFFDKYLKGNSGADPSRNVAGAAAVRKK